MTQVKICGISRQEELAGIRKGKPDYVGFVFAPSKRQVTPEQALHLTKELDASIQRVGVFVNLEETELLKMAHQVSLDVIQLHGDESPAYCQRVKGEGYRIWKSFTIGKPDDLNQMRDYLADGYLLDAAGPLRGGNGVTFPWELARNISVEGKLVLAGGINAGNIIEAIETVNPDIVDISSGVEVKGIKSEEKIRELMDRLRSVAK